MSDDDAVKFTGDAAAADRAVVTVIFLQLVRNGVIDGQVVIDDLRDIVAPAAPTPEAEQLRQMIASRADQLERLLAKEKTAGS